MKTIDINIKEYTDKPNGNIYFSARIILDYGTYEEDVLYSPRQDGRRKSAHFEAACAAIRDSRPALDFQPAQLDPGGMIIVRYNVWQGCSRKECDAWSVPD